MMVVMGMSRHAEPDRAAEEVLVTVEAFEGFYAREYRAVLTLAHALTGDPGQAEDLTQETFLSAYLAWGALRNPAGWVRAAVSNKAMSWWRRTYAATRAMTLVGRPEAAAEMPPDTSAFWAEVRRLPRRQAEAVALYYLEDRSVSEISAVLGCAQSTTRMHLSRGRRALASKLGVAE